MNELFSFSTNLIEANINDSIQIFSKYTYPKNITLKLESNLKHLNGYYVIKANDNKVLTFILTENTTIKATKIWGANWDNNGYLDCNIKLIDSSTKHIETNKIINHKEKHKILNYYKKHKNVKKAFIKQRYTFKKSNDNIYYIDILKNISNLVISDNASYKIIKNTNDNKITIEFNKLKELNVILSITLDHKTFNIPGQEILNDNDLHLLIDQIYNVFITNNIQNIKLDYNDSKFYIIETKKSIFSRIKFNGPEKSISYSFNTNKSLTNKIKIFHKHYNDNIITISAPNEYNNNICTLNIIQPNNTKIYLDYYIHKGKCFVTLKSDTLMWIFDISNYKEDFSIICNNINNVTIHKKIKINKQFNKSIYYTIKHFKSSTEVNIFSNKIHDEEFLFTLNVLNNSLSKENEDFIIKQSNFKILKNKKYKQIKINWLNNKPLKDVKLQINDTLIPIKKINAEYYPSNIVLNNTNMSYKHTLNKLVNKDLILKYLDGDVSDTIILSANSRHFVYHPLSDVVNWQVFDNDTLIFEQDIFYKKAINEITIDYNNIVKYYNTSYIIVKTTHTFNENIKIKIESKSNINIDISGEYIIKHNESEIKIPITAKRKYSVGWIAFRVYSLTDNIVINSKKHIIMFN